MPTKNVTSLTALLLISLGWQSLWAADGVIEINESCAAGPGCMPGDLAGYPVSISSSGSYLLTSNLNQADENQNMIEIGANDVTLDLGGFALIGATVCTSPSLGEPVSQPCTNEGDGIGISDSVQTRNVTIRNGTIRGMGGKGIELGHARIEDIHALSNGNTGIQAGADSTIINSESMFNSHHGIFLSDNVHVVNAKAHYNAAGGINAAYYSIIRDSSAIANGANGFSCFAFEEGGCTLENIRSRDNGSRGVLMGNESILRSSTVTANSGGGVFCGGETTSWCLVQSCVLANNNGEELEFENRGGYLENVIIGNIPSTGTNLGANLCNNGILCP